jgi:glycosyltransferase involved in cell wall biosynthesis
MSSPAISVLIPCYNQARYLAQTLESVLAQKNVSLEVIVSDDCSKDETADIAERFASADSRIRVQRHQQNLGMANNWNWCLEQARGEFIKYVFGDDYLTAPDSLEQLLAPLLADPLITLSTSARLIVDANTKPVTTTQDFPRTCRLAGTEAITRCLLENRNLIGEPSAVLFRRSAARPFDASYRQLIDVELWYHLLTEGDFYYIDQPLCAFRRHKLQQTALNQLGRLGEREGIRLHLNYKSLLKKYLAAGGSKHLVRQAQFRTLYYAGKAKVPSDDHAANEAELRKRLKVHWYVIYWLHHRLTKPVSNLRKAVGIPERGFTI